MLAILSSLNAHSFPIFQPILMILVSKTMVHKALSDITYLSLGLLNINIGVISQITKKKYQKYSCPIKPFFHI